MRRFPPITVAVAIACLAGSGSPAQAKAVGCDPPRSFSGSLTVRHVGCSKGRRVMQRYFDLSSRGPNDQSVNGFDCTGHYTPRGPKVSCIAAHKRQIKYLAPAFS